MHLPHICVAAMLLGMPVSADTIVFEAQQPTLDRWEYPFNTDIGNKAETKIFGANDPSFDNRDGQMVLAFDTAADIPTGLPLDSYEIISATITLMTESDETFRYDATSDAWQTYLPAEDDDAESDTDDGRPIELFGAGFRNGFTSVTFTETTPYSPAGPFGKGVRTCFPIAFDNAAPVDVSNSLDEAFDPVPFAIGTTTTVASGELVPALTDFAFEIDVNDPDIAGYLQQSLADGITYFTVASMFPATQQTGGSFPEFFTKENAAVGLGASAARVTLVVNIAAVPGDTNGDAIVNLTDLLNVLSQWGTCPVDEDCAGDVTDDGFVGLADLLNVLANWG